MGILVTVNQGSCDNCCSNCCFKYSRCRTNQCCHKACHAECRTSSCRSSCRKSCYETIKVNVTGNQQAFESSKALNATVKLNTTNNNLHNITTVINLKNVINNTNVIDIPINLDYQNQNNITIGDEEGYSSSGDDGDKCCIVIGPRQCVPTSEFPFIKCFHTRSKQCGWYCTAAIVHQEQQDICQRNLFGSPINCKQETTYIPQPQPKCAYTTSWPYVSCGLQPQASCQGCYGHYFRSDSNEFMNCPSQCYDNGYGAGPYYRQGPFYQQTYSHTPPCNYFWGGCENMGNMGNMGLGGYGVYGGFNGYGSGIPYGSFNMQPNVPINPWFWNQLPLFKDLNITDISSNNTELFNPIISSMAPQSDSPYLDDPPKDPVFIDVKIEPPTKTPVEG